METPSKITASEWERRKAEYLAEEAYIREDGEGWKHRCGAPLLGFNTRVSEHDVRFGDVCCGMGDTVQIEVPYCPSCEPHPAESGCIHV
jgi:hypothetical protein